ncbi:MAG: quinolinate synthase NadA [Elusimicrobia bacterium]|nr:quinolinate synthase NadA [Elusimicrobiota bacterium]
MDKALAEEIIRLKSGGLSSLCSDKPLKEIAELTLEINKLKKEKNAVICAHVYQRPEIISGIGDFVGDSYKLAKDAVSVKAENIIFCGVHFMAETAKILNPEKRVFLPDMSAGCSLSESIKASDIIKLKKKHPGSPVALYINTSAKTKAESDVIVTSANAEKILIKLFEKHKKVIFLPDKYMGANLAKKLNKKIGKEIILWDGSCEVHEKFDSSLIKEQKKLYPGLVAMAHSECPSDIINAVDFMGGTGDMMKYIEATNAKAYMLITECGMGELAKMKFPNKNFISMCRLCPYMKSITLEKVLDTLIKLPAKKEIKVGAKISEKAKKAIEKMFELAG